MATSSINTLVHSALDSVTSYSKAIDGLRIALKGQMAPDVRVAILPAVAGFYKVALVAKERGEGVTLDVNAKSYEAAKKAVQRLTKDIVGKVAKDSVEIEVPEALMIAARKLIKLASEYEGAAKLVSKALATARAE